RTHSTKDARLNKEIWNFRGDYFNAQYDAIRLRYTLSSYIYTMARKTYDTGISLCRPMYYDYPDKEEAYSFDKQYFFGDDILVAPIGKPMTDGFSKIKVWLPEGNDWYEWHTGTLLKGGQTIEREFSLDEYPIYIKAGAIIPMVRDAKNLDKESNKITLGIFPGGISQSELYEDNGNDKNYQQKYAYTHFKSEKLEDGSIKISISPREGEYNEMEANKLYQIKLYGSQMPSAIHVNGKSLNYSNEAGESWNYTRADLSVNIKLSEMAASQSIVIQVYFDNNQFAEINNGLIEKLKRLNKATTELKIKRGRIVVPTSIGQAEETNLKLEYHPENFKSTINDFNKYYEDIPRSIRTLNIGKEVEEWYLNYLGFYRN
ncbi:MAG TPA: glycoside hydrolase family 31 protein, partial [Candidatus Dojkabacteria bacterium]|nr:glycoside hydrolase family 31 protein [Candidatus Dojkabacteria bacterium]